MKTTDDINTCIYRYLSTRLTGKLSGAIYNGTDRPLSSTEEDVVIKTIANNTSQRQEAIVNVNVYVPDILHGKEYVVDGDRLPAIERLMMNVLERFFAGEALVTMESQSVMPSANGKEHVINNRLNYKFINDF